MKLEEALAEMRNGKKITHQYLGEDVYLMGCYVTLFGSKVKMEPEMMSIVKMKGDKMHPDMRSNQQDFNHKIDTNCKYALMPHIPLLLLMANDWEVL